MPCPVCLMEERDSWQAKYDALQQSHDKLMEYEMKHKKFCPKGWQYVAPDTNCTCGLDQALAEAEKIT